MADLAGVEITTVCGTYLVGVEVLVCWDPSRVYSAIKKSYCNKTYSALQKKLPFGLSDIMLFSAGGTSPRLISVSLSPLVLYRKKFPQNFDAFAKKLYLPLRHGPPNENALQLETTGVGERHCDPGD